MSSRSRSAVGLFVVLALTASGCSGDTHPGPSPTSGSVSLAECADVALAPCDTLVAHASIPLAGTSWSLMYSSDRVPGRRAEPTADVRGLGLGGWMLSDVHVLDGHVLLLGDGGRRTVSPIAGRSGEQIVASVDGAEAYVFDGAGHHLRTVSAGWGIVTRSMSYDAAGRLTTVRDVYGDEFVMQRDPSNLLTGIAGAGIDIVLTTNARGFLTSATDGAGAKYAMTPDPDGLVTAFVDADNQRTVYDYDAAGHLIGTTDSSGATWTATWTDMANGHRIEHRTPTGETTSLTVEQIDAGHVRSTVVAADGRESVADTWKDGRRRLVTATGGQTEVQLAPDPRFGFAAPVIERLTHHDASGSSEATTSVAADGLDDADPLGLGRLTVTVTDAGSSTTVVTDRVARTQTSVTPGGATTQLEVDAHGDVVRVSAPAQEPVTIARDDHGAVVSVQHGSAGVPLSVATDPSTGVATVTDALGRATMFQRDRRSGIAVISMADGRQVIYRATAAGTPISATGPGGATEIRTSDERGLPSGGASSVSGSNATSVTRDPSGRVTDIDRADGQSMAVVRDDAGRTKSITTTVGTTSFEYDDRTGLVTDLTAPGDIGLHRTYAGTALAQESLTGPVTGTVAFAFDELGRPHSVDVAGVASTIQYDDAGRVRTYGPVDITYAKDTGAVAGRTVGEVSTSIASDAAGRQDGQTVSAAGRELYSENVTFDVVGRVSTRTERLEGATSVTTFAYDLTDRLTSVSVDGAPPTTYTYDEGDNLVERSGDEPVTATFDPAGRVQSIGDERYTFTGNGVLASKASPEGTTTYDYDEQGNLRGVVLPDGRTVTYLIDPAGRRVGKEIDGTLVAGWLYNGPEVVAELDGNGNVVARYLDGAPGAPSAMTVGGWTLSIVTDRWGSPKLIVDAATGEMVDRIDRDVWGAVVDETAPGTTSLGFLGGISDPDTGLVHLGSRDYDPTIGRFTAPDPAGIHGLRTNLYAYAGNNPVNRVDASGRTDEELDRRNNDALLSLLGDLSQGIGNMAGVKDGAFGAALDVGQLAASLGSLGNNPNLGNAVAGLGNLVSAIAAFEGITGDFGKGFSIAGKAITFEKSAVDLGNVLGQYANGQASGVDVVRAVVKLSWDAANLLQAIDAVYKGALTSSLPSALGILGAIGLGLAGACFLACQDSEGRTAFNDFGRRIFGPSYDGPERPDDSLLKKLWRRSGKSFGDPHMVTFDGRPFDFQAVGEFVLVRSTVDDFAVQIRTVHIAQGTSISVVAGVAIGTGAHRITWVEGADILIDGARMSGAVQPLSDGTTVLRDPTGSPTVVLADGTQVEVQVDQGGAVIVGLGDARLDTVQGLLGDADGDPANDMVTADGSSVDATQLPGIRTLTDGWRVTSTTSLFDYAPGTDTSTFTDLDSPQETPTLDGLDSTARAAAEAVCRAAGVTDASYLDACTFDVALTGDVSYALAARTAMDAVPTETTDVVEHQEAFAIDVGDSVSPGTPSDGAGVLEDRADVDVYTFTAESATSVTVTADLTVTSAAARSGLDWEVASTAGLSIGHGNFDGDPSASTGPPTKVDLPAGGDYTLTVRRHDDGADPLEYGFELAATTNDSKAAQAGQEYSGSIDAAGDTRDFELTVTAGQALAVEDLQPCDGDSNLTWSVIDEAGDHALLPVDATGTSSAEWRTGSFCDAVGRLEFPAAGTYRFRVTTQASSWTGEFSFRVTTPRDDRFEIGAVDEVAPGKPGPGAGTIESQGSIDIYTFDVAEPVYYRLDTTPVAGTCAGGEGPTMSLFGPDGAAVVSDIPTCADRTTVHLVDAGTYTAVVGSYTDRGTGIATGTYRFQLTR